MKLWQGLVIAVASLVLQACLVTVMNYLLGRHMGNQLSVLSPPSNPQGPFPRLQQDQHPLETPNVT